ncbi:hypothetical protein [Streptacidiphilus sp. EB103A]|uniref:hypothetical protein n=1 Tax=Streptacidiphilus sp. EB103A TaxID=3156275 RepID=UPI003517AC77
MADLTAAHAALGGTTDRLSLDLDSGWAAPLELAITSGQPLWSDDLFIREAARAAGVPAFGTRALTRVLAAEQRTPDTGEADDARWLAGRVVDLPHHPTLLVAQAEAEHWLPGAVAAALIRPAAWHSPTALSTWATITSQVVAQQPDQLGPWLYLASLGAAAAPSDPATLCAQLLAIACIEAGPGAAASLTEAGMEAARRRDLPADQWRQAVINELGTAIAAGHLPGLTPAAPVDLTGQLVQGI